MQMGHASMVINAFDPPAVPVTAVLIIDESATYRGALGQALQEAGYGVITAENGAAGLVLAGTCRPQAVMVGGVASGIDGATVIRRLRHDPDLCGVACVLIADEDDHAAEAAAIAAGADAFARKDEEFATILARLATVLGRADRRGEVHTRAMLRPKRILAVDDSVTYREELAAALRDEGYGVVIAHTGEHALEVLQVEAVDCIVLDLMMPGIGGREACRRIRAMPMVRDIPVIMVTSHDDPADIIAGLGAGADDYIAKSGDFQMVKARVGAQMRRQGFHDENRRNHEDVLRRERETIQARAARELDAARAVLFRELEIKNGALEVSEALAHANEITARKERAAMERILAIVSHDLRAPLQGIRACIDLLTGHGEVSASGLPMCAAVRSEASRLVDLATDLIDVSRISHRQMPWHWDGIDAPAVINEVVAAMQAVAGADRVQVVVGTVTTSVARGDGAACRRLLMNLVSNAIRHARAGIITVSAETSPAQLRFTVADDGRGIDPGVGEHLGRPFAISGEESPLGGVGLGLAICLGIAAAHDGQLTIHSRRGQGTRITVDLRTDRERPLDFSSDDLRPRLDLA